MLRLVLVNILELMKYFIIYSFLLGGERYKGKRKYVGIIVLFVGFVLRTFIFKTDDAVTSVIFLFIVLFTIYAGRVKNKILFHILIFITVNYLDTIIFSVLGYVIKGKIWWYYIYDSGWVAVYESLISVALILVISLLYRWKKRKNYLFSPVVVSQYLLLSGTMLGLYIIFVIMLIVMAYGQPGNKNRLYIVIVVAAVLTITCIIAFFLYSNYLKKQNDIHIENLQLYDKDTELRAAYYEHIKSMNDDMRKYRHDFRHHVSTMERLVEEGEYLELKGYLNQLYKQDLDLKQKMAVYTGNYIVDAVITGIVEQKKYENVEFQCVGKLPEKLYIEDVDICGVLANALENAMEASLGSQIKQCVSMKTGCYENIVTFQIKNTYDSEKYAELSKGQFATSKNEDGHGYGISNMYRIAKQYAGRIEYTVEKDCVIVDIYLQQNGPDGMM